MKSKLFIASLVVSSLSACGGGSSSQAPVAATAAVPAEAATSPAAATSYVGALSVVAEAQTDSLEPIAALPDSLATDDTAEPALVQ